MLTNPLHKKYWSFGSSDGLYVICRYITKINTTKIATLNIINGTIQFRLTYDALDIVDIEGVDDDENVRIGTSIGGTEINYSWNAWLPEAIDGLILL
jgi:hypothetical protein